MHQIGQTAILRKKVAGSLTGEEYEIEVASHHHEATYKDCIRDCPEGWSFPSRQMLEAIRLEALVANESQSGDPKLPSAREYILAEESDRVSEGFALYYFAPVNSCVGSTIQVHTEDPSSKGIGARYVRKVS